MELSGTTFLLEIINFLVLVWLLQRYFFSPVRDIISRRREQIANALASAKEERAAAEDLRRRYEGRLTSWVDERQAAVAKLHAEIEAQRTHLLQEVQEDIERQRTKARVLVDRERDQQLYQLEVRALATGARFSARLLQRIAGPAVEQQLVKAALADLRALSSERRSQLQQAWQSGGDSMQVVSAYPLDSATRAAIENALIEIKGSPLPVEYRVDCNVIAGLRVSLGPWLLRANLADELKSFADAAKF